MLRNQGQVCPPSTVCHQERLDGGFICCATGSCFQHRIQLIIIPLIEGMGVQEAVGLLLLNRLCHLRVWMISQQTRVRHHHNNFFVNQIFQGSLPRTINLPDMNLEGIVPFGNGSILVELGNIRSSLLTLFIHCRVLEFKILDCVPAIGRSQDHTKHQYSHSI